MQRTIPWLLTSIATAFCGCATMQQTQFVSRSYPIPRNSISSMLTTTNQTQECLQDGLQPFLVDAGIPFPRGSWIHYSHGRLIVYNTPKNLELFEQLFVSLGPDLPQQVEIEATLVCVSLDSVPEVTARRTVLASNIASLPPSKRPVMDKLRIVTGTGIHSQVRNSRTATDIRQLGTPINSVAATTNFTNSTDSSPRTSYDLLGTCLNVTPTIAPDGQHIFLTFAWDRRVLLDWLPAGTTNTNQRLALTDEKSVMTSITLVDGSSAVFQLTDSPAGFGERTPKNHRNGAFYLIVTARLVDPTGKPFSHSSRNYRPR